MNKFHLLIWLGLAHCCRRIQRISRRMDGRGEGSQCLPFCRSYKFAFSADQGSNWIISVPFAWYACILSILNAWIDEGACVWDRQREWRWRSQTTPFVAAQRSNSCMMHDTSGIHDNQTNPFSLSISCSSRRSRALFNKFNRFKQNGHSTTRWPVGSSYPSFHLRCT